MNPKGMHRQRRFLLIGSAVGVIAVFLPWVRMDVGGFLQGMGINNSVNGFRGMGILVFIAFLVCGVLPFNGAPDRPLEKVPWFVVLVAGSVSIIGIAGFFINMDSSMGGGFGVVEMSFGAGAILALAAALFVSGTVWFIKPAGYSIKDSWENITKNKFSLPGSGAGQKEKPMNMEELEKLITLRNEGKITEVEYQRLKSELFAK